MRIHHLEVRNTTHVAADERTGKPVLVRDKVLGPSGTTAITYEGVQYNVQQDGTFDVPDEVGAYYMRGDGWFGGPNPFAEQFQAEAATQVAAPTPKLDKAAA